MGLRRMRAALNNRAGVFLAVLVITVAGLGGALRVVEVQREIRAAATMFESTLLREGFIALMDISHLATLLHDLRLAGDIGLDQKADVTRAADTLYVRIDSFARYVRSEEGSAVSARAHASLRRLMVRLDQAAAEDYANPKALSDDFNLLAASARRDVIAFLDSLRDEQARVLDQQSRILQELVLSLSVLIASLAGISGAALYLLRREIASRRQRDSAERRADFLAFNDPLTELPNRAQFYEHLAERLSAGEPLAMIFFDIDNFKGLNDTYGHNAGDTVLREVARRLRDAVEDLGGMAARLGGDEFAAILPSSDRSDAETFCIAFMIRTRRSIAWENLRIPCRLSIGVALSDMPGLAGGTPGCEALVGAADFALYDAKLSGRNTYRFYDEALAERHAERRRTLEEMPAALARGEFFAVYQPKVRLDTGERVGFEALIRWRRDGLVVPPSAFLPLAEESGLIVDLDMWILGEATRQMAAWNEASSRPLSVSVNLSAVNLTDRLVVNAVARALAMSGLEPALLTLEITETVLIEEWDRIHGVLSELKALGVRISLDDFGTGYSSLAYLRRIDADELKIDRSFVAEVESSDQTRFILDSIIDIAASLGMEMVVEGIETRAQADIIRTFGCDMGQGFLFGHPLTADEAETCGWHSPGPRIGGRKSP